MTIAARLMRASTVVALVLAFSLARASDASSVPAPPWPDTFAARIDALALIQTLNADLLSHDSATATLEHWCDVHHLASPARIVASRVLGVDKAPTDDQRRELNVATDEPIRYRRVRLQCGPVVLSEADNWYVPDRLSEEMNALLDTTDTPFGKVVKALNFRRRTLSATLLWRPLAEGWEMLPVPHDGTGNLPIPHQLLEHRAVLTLTDGTPFSEVVETYTENILAFPLPGLRHNATPRHRSPAAAMPQESHHAD